MQSWDKNEWAETGSISNARYVYMVTHKYIHNTYIQLASFSVNFLNQHYLSIPVTQLDGRSFSRNTWYEVCNKTINKLLSSRIGEACYSWLLRQRNIVYVSRN